MVDRSLPFQRTTELGSKFVPATSNERASPAGAQLGKSTLIVGATLAVLVTANVMAFETPPPGAGLVTVTVVSPVEAILEAGMAAVNCVELTKVVATAPPKLTVEDALKFVPLTVSVKAAPPAAALFGEMLMTDGVGFDSLGGG